MSEITALCFIKVERYRFDELVEEIKQIPYICRYSVITGDFDGVLEIKVDQIDKLYEIFRKIENIEKIIETDTHIVIKEYQFPTNLPKQDNII